MSRLKLPKSLKRVLKQPWVHNLAAWAIAFYIKIVYKTSRWVVIDAQTPQDYQEGGRPFITCFWHGRLLMLPCAWQDKGHFYMLNSSHRDGQLMAKALKHFKIRSISGSTSKGGVQALRQILRCLKSGFTVGITPDGPRGPCHKVSLGTLTIAQLAQADIIPVTFSTSRYIRLKTWDQFMLGLPFSRGAFVWGKPIPCPLKSTPENLEEVGKKLEAELERIHELADQACQKV